MDSYFTDRYNNSLHFQFITCIQQIQRLQQGLELHPAGNTVSQPQRYYSFI